MESKQTLIYDIASCPMNAGLSMEHVFKLYKEENIVVYDSAQNYGTAVNKPQIVNVPENSTLKFFDLSKEEDIIEFNKIKR